MPGRWDILSLSVWRLGCRGLGVVHRRWVILGLPLGGYSADGWVIGRQGGEQQDPVRERGCRPRVCVGVRRW